MLQIDSKTFNPEILYVFDCWGKEPVIGKKHAHGFAEISVILEGEAHYTIEDQTFTAQAGTVMLFNPGVYHQDTQLENTQSHQLHIGIKNIVLEGYKRDYFPFTSSIIHLGDRHPEFINRCWRLIEEKSKRDIGYDLMIKTLIMEIIVLILRSESSKHIEVSSLNVKETDKEKQAIVNNIIYYLENHHSEEISLDTLSDTMYISSTYISKVFKEETGDSPINYLIKLRLNRAKQLLETQNITVKEAAETVGYQDAYHFSKLFKKHYGKSPSELINKATKH
ncbi:helix-turn-helix transcriptional regulator [Vagococcus sp. BWB3-3]|uniref:Helix-turn-helix transcriptional regulator n=1 Tax=Vagococcus allomyrinae TaxID=2794353 RepID=A0A940SVL7_9ENTE|nr:AraC family transcriptional regulator [Vagococcus allomyrinae]MBP1041999.1 helix-turn-helix transcriptional regulator [Vagococcus allomyrinae]